VSSTRCGQPRFSVRKHLLPASHLIPTIRSVARERRPIGVVAGGRVRTPWCHDQCGLSHSAVKAITRVWVSDAECLLRVLVVRKRPGGRLDACHWSKASSRCVWSFSESWLAVLRPAGVLVMPRRTILTQAALAHVTSLVGQGQSAAQIASDIGCTLGTLRVRCCHFGTSLLGALQLAARRPLPQWIW
jgi:hypothetical protein